MLIDTMGVTIHDALERNCRTHPSKSFILAYDRAFTYEEAYRLSNGFARFLTASGVGKNDKACLILPRVPELVLAFLGMAKAGVIPIPVNYTVSPGEIKHFISLVAPSVIVIHEKLLPVLDSEILLLRSIRIVVVGEDSHGHIPWEEASSPAVEKGGSDIGFNKIAYLNYTTGSSGTPKGAIATHANIYWNTRASVEAMEMTGDDVHLCMFASFAHPHELFARPLYTGGTIVLLEEINPKTIVKTINDKSVTCMMGLAPMFDMIASHCSHKEMESLRVAESGGMYTRPDIIGNFKKYFGVPVLSVWGSTETTGIALANTPRAYRDDGSTGRVCPFYELRIIDDEGNDVGDGEVGELVFRGEGVISGYYNSTDFHVADGWYYSGDLGWKDEEGYLYFVERKSGLMKVAGLKVYPLQIEISLMAHHGIKEAAVIGVEDRLRGMVPKAYIVPREGFDLTEEDVRAFCKGKMADYMIPKAVEIRSELPKIGSGKINKKALGGR
ncbi:MAG: acyl--CoA ligase [Alphaproteobacteria bacterium]|uniref:Acyl--CoA ligase n=1 Tax=Candidatus Nitrobium versatile TaxID=2884831 RepID=A0A953JCV6_9BACT|nr:acyl--CoA ligase [Candidatus Nitrobium versatile]